MQDVSDKRKTDIYKTLLILMVFLLLVQIVLVPLPTAATPYNFSEGTLIIPMDTAYQNYGMWRAYGLVYNLLSNGIPVSWAISDTKSFNGIDFTASANDLRTNAGITNHAYSGGPFVIASADAARAIPLIQAWWLKYANQPAVHQATDGFFANVDIVLKSPPRIATEATNAGIAIAYYNTAGIPDLNGLPWTSTSPNILTQTQIVNGALFSRGACSTRQFDIFVTPHNGGYSYSLTDPNNLGTRTYAELDYFVQQGGGWMALCHSILSNENAISNLYRNSSPAVRNLFTGTKNGGFLTETGFSTISNTGGTWTVEEPNLPISQSVRTVVTQALPGGSVQTWPRTSVQYHSHTEKVAHFVTSAGVIHDWAINGAVRDGTGLGKITFLGGHSYDTKLPYSGNMEAPYLRFFYNGLFFNGSAVAKLDLSTTPTDIPSGIESIVDITLANTGSSTATNPTQVSIRLAPGVEYVSTSISPTPTVTEIPTTAPDYPGTTLLSWGSSLNSIPGNSTVGSVRVKVKPTTSGEWQIAHFSAKYGDVYNEAFTADLCRAINVYAPPKPEISKTPKSQTYYPGQTAEWTLTYRNTSTVAGTSLLNAVIEDILPAEFTFKSATPAPTSVVPLADGTTRVRWSIGTLAPNTSGTITLKAFVAGTGEYTNQAELSGIDAFAYPYLVADTADVTVISPLVNLVKAVSPTGAIERTTPGQILTYKIRPSYYGESLLSNVQVSDPVPAYTTYVTSSANAGGSLGYTSRPKVDGVDSETFGTGKSTTVSITASPTTAEIDITTVTVSMIITNNSGANITGIVPTLTELQERATLLTGPSATNFNLTNGASQTVTYTFRMNAIGELRFSGTASGISAVAGVGEYTFTDGISNTVLVTSFLKTANEVVIWRLGSNLPGVPGEVITSGLPAGIYAFRGGNTREFSKFTLMSNAWSVRSQPTNGIEKGGSLTVDPATNTIYAMEGNSKWFYQYVAVTNIWTRLADTSDNANEGGGVQFLTVGGQKYVYALLGNSNRFRRYNISNNTWTNLTNIPVTVKRGGALTTDGTYLYALQGDTKTGFYRYDIAANTWTAMTPTPAGVGWGGSLTRIGEYIYGLRGDGKPDFWRYNISANTWTAMTPAPGNVGDGGALTNDGTAIYALQGKTKTFWRYNITDPDGTGPITANSWTVMPTTNFTGNVGQGGALVYNSGITPTGFFTKMQANASLVTDGDEITVTMTIESSTPVNNVTPSTVTVTSANGATATLKEGWPKLKSADDDITDIHDVVVYEWVYVANAGTNPGSLIFTASASGTSPTTSFPAATSRSVLVTPELTYQARVFDAADIPDSVDQVVNFAMIGDLAGLGISYESNRVSTPLLKPILTLRKINTPSGTVAPGGKITYMLVLANEGNGSAQGVLISDVIPSYSDYVPDSAVVPTGVTVTEPTSPSNTLIFDVGTLPAGESITVSFEVTAKILTTPGSYVINNVSTVTATNLTATVTSNNVTNTLNIIADFDVMKVASVVLVNSADEEIVYSIYVTNTGNIPLTSISLSDPFFPSDSQPAYNSGDLNEDGKLNPGEIWTYTATYTVTQADFDQNSGVAYDLINTVTINTAETGPKSASEYVLIDCNPMIHLEKTGSWVDSNANGWANPDEPIHYTFTVTNPGNVTLTEVTVTDPLISNIVYQSGDENGNGKLDLNETWTYSATYLITQADIDMGKVDNTASAKSLESEPHTDDNTVLLTQNPLLAIVKTGVWEDGNGDGNADIGESVTFTFTVTNIGTVTLNHVTVSDPLSGLSPVNPAQIDGVPPGASVVFTATYILTQADIDAAQVVNTATANSNESEPDTSTFTLPLKVTAAVRITKIVTLPVGGGGYKTADALTPFKVRLTSTEQGYASDVVLKAGQTMILEVPCGVYTIQEIAIPMEYALVGIQIREYTAGMWGEWYSLTPESMLDIQAEEVEIRVTNTFTHIKYFRDSADVKNQFTPQ